MMRKVKGIASATKMLSDGSKVRYWYAWRGGPRIVGKYGSPEFWAHYNELIAKRFAPKGETLASLIAEFKASQQFLLLSPRTKRDYPRAFNTIIEKFGQAPLRAFEDRRMRGDILAWRDEFSATPCKADGLWAALRRVLSFGCDRGKLAYNVCARGGRLYSSDRSDIIWTDEHLELFEKIASPEVLNVVILALWTGQREADLLALPWTAYDGEKIRLRQQKSNSKVKGKVGRIVSIPCAKPLREKLDKLRAINEARPVPSSTILTNTLDKPWTTEGFGTAWQRCRIKFDEAFGEKTGLHFHDLRGTAITRLSLAGCTVPEIASITGHSLQTVQSILDKYLCRDERLAESAIRKLEENEEKKKTANRLQTKKKY